MTTFAQLAKGGQQGEGITLAPGKPEESYLVELIRPGGQPRMPYKQDPLAAEKIATIERWVAEGAKYDGGAPTEDWTILLRKTQSVSVPESYPAAVPITALAFTRDGSAVAASGYHEVTFWKTADGTLARRLGGLAERTYDIAYSPDGKWMATASGDPGIFGVARLWSAEPGGAQAGPRPGRDPGRGVLRRVQPRQQAARHRRRRPRDPHLRGRDRQARSSRSRTTPTGSSPSPSAPTASGSPAPAATRRARSSTSRRRSRSSPSPAMPSRSTRSRSRPTASRSPAAARTTGSGSGTPTPTASRSARSAASAARSSASAYSPDGQTLVACSADKTVHVFKATGLFHPQAARPPGLDLLPGHLHGRQDDRLGELGRRRPALEPRRRQADPQLHRRPGLQAGGDHESRRS